MWKPSSFGVALVLHLCLLGGILIGSRSEGHSRGEPPLRVTFLKFSDQHGANEAPSVPGTSAADVVDAAERKTLPAVAPPEVVPVTEIPEDRSLPKMPAEIVQPLIMPETIITEPIASHPSLPIPEMTETGTAGGVPGSVAGGIPGGVVGGESAPAGPLRAGGPVTTPFVLERARPEYPVLARNARVEGEVILEAVILRDGTVGDIRVVRALRLGCTQAAIEALRQWKFLPGTYHGIPTDVYFELTVEFILG